MATFVYAPAIRVRIESESKGIIDVSGDIVNWTLTRRTNTVSSFNFVLQNAQRKYDQVFRPSDRITVELKRITWVRVFTGTLNNSPIFSAWPRALPLSASCSLKKLQFWPWDPTTTAANDLVQKFFANTNTTQTAVGDGGLSKLVTEALVQVCNWDRKAIHFGQVPNNWFKWAEKTEQLIDDASNMAAVLGSTATIRGNQVIGQIDLPPGTYANVTLDQTQVDAISSMYAIVLGQSGLSTTALQDRAMLILLMTIMQESTIENVNHGPDGSLGFFQQIPSWGSATERRDITYSTKAFLKGVNGHEGLLQIDNWHTMDPGQAAQAVQVSAHPDKYKKHQPFATMVVAALRTIYNRQILATGTNSETTTPGAFGQPNGRGAKKGTGTNVAAVAVDLVRSRPAGSIRYQLGNDDPPQSTAPTVLDCSSLVEWVYYHATGSLLNRRTSQMQYASVIKIPVELAQFIQGALVFVVDNGDAHHVGISMGNNNHVAAHTDDVPLVRQVTAGSPIIGQFNAGGLMPGIDYSSAATTQEAATKLKAILKENTNVSTSTLGPENDPSVTTGPGSTTTGATVLEQLVNVIANPPVVSGDIFGGARGLIHNTTFLPWIKNVTNSSMRAFCSAPNGDFIAWFPDYFNVWGTAAVMNVQPIELKDFTVDWSDQQIVTHEFVIGSIASLLDNNSGGIVDGSDSSYAGITAMMSTKGIATMDFPQIFQAIYGKPASKKFVTDYLTRFGARPNLDQMANIKAGRQEFFMALWNFMYYWSAQFSATIPMTFMPELYPGMILKIPAFDFQAYVTEVTHSGSYGPNGGFTTQATIVAPARMSSATDLFGMLPLGGR